MGKGGGPALGKSFRGPSLKEAKRLTFLGPPARVGFLG